MRPKSSDELPRFASDGPPSPLARIKGRQRYACVLVMLFVVYLLWPARTRPAATSKDAIAVDWQRFAYSLYATNSATLCHAVLVFEALARLGSKADRVLFYPRYWDTKVKGPGDRDSQLLVLARDQYRVKLQPVQLLSVRDETDDASTAAWDQGVSKFLALSLAYYDRVVALESDVTLLQPLDELFLLPAAPMAMPRAYWYLDRPLPLTPLLMVVTPDVGEFDRLRDAIMAGGYSRQVEAQAFEMALVNDRYASSALVLPHRPYALLSGEFRKHNHSAYLGNAFEPWDADAVYREAKLVHFSDWPLPKPWVMWSSEALADVQPDCGGSHQGTCPERTIWKALYQDFRQRRRDVCKYLSIPAPEWTPLKDQLAGANATGAQP